MSKLAQIVYGLVFFYAGITTSAAQNYVYAVGNPSSSTQIPIDNGFIDLDNGNLHFEISIASPPQRGKLKLNERLVYDSRIWQIVSNGSRSWQPTNVPNSMGGWRFTTGLENGTKSVSSAEQLGGTGTCQVGPRYMYDFTETYRTYSNFSWTDAQGTTHLFPFQTSQPEQVCNGDTSYTSPSAADYAVDGSGYYGRVSSYRT